MALNLKRITANDRVMKWADIINDNFDEIIASNGGLRGLQGIQGIQGIQGLPGLQGIQGLQGLSGAQWFVGSDNPNTTSPIGAVINDLYIDVTTSSIYKFDGSTWNLEGVSLVTGFFSKTNNDIQTINGQDNLLLTPDHTNTTNPFIFKLRVANSGNQLQLVHHDGLIGGIDSNGTSMLFSVANSAGDSTITAPKLSISGINELNLSSTQDINLNSNNIFKNVNASVITNAKNVEYNLNDTFEIGAENINFLSNDEINFESGTDFNIDVVNNINITSDLLQVITNDILLNSGLLTMNNDRTIINNLTGLGLFQVNSENVDMNITDDINISVGNSMMFLDSVASELSGDTVNLRSGFSVLSVANNSISALSTQNINLTAITDFNLRGNRIVNAITGLSIPSVVNNYSHVILSENNIITHPTSNPTLDIGADLTLGLNLHAGLRFGNIASGSFDPYLSIETSTHESVHDYFQKNMRINNFISGYFDYLGSLNFTNQISSATIVIENTNNTTGDKLIQFRNGSTNIGRFEYDGVTGITAFGISHSDKLLKHDIKNTEYGLTDLLKLNVKDFKWNNVNKKDCGLIAQEVTEILPHVVYDGSSYNNENELKPGDNDYRYMEIHYNKLVPLLIKSVQELSEENKIIKAQIEKILK